MKSIRARVTRLIVLAVLVALALIGGASILSIRLQEDVGSERFMSLICETGSEHINERLLTAEQSVTAVATYVDESLSVMELVKGGVIGATGSGISLRGHDFASASQQDFDAYLSEHVQTVETMFTSTVAQNEGIVGYYYRINPEISHAELGFLRSKSIGGDYAWREPTDITNYASNDYANMGWYYLPQESGRPTWVGPYMDTNQQVEVISFIAPLYKADTFIGVVGMDIAYDYLVEQIEGLEVLSSGYAFLTDNHGEIVYHPTLPRQMSLRDVTSELETAESGVEGPSLISYKLDGTEKKAAWQQLENTMRLFVCAPVSEVNARSYGSTLLMLGVVALVMAILITAVMFEVRRITRPLEDLTEAATKIAEGDYNVSLTYDQDDEVGILTKSFRHLVENLKVRIAYLYNQAYKDALTGVRNKAAYDAFVEDVDNAIARGELEHFAVVAFDCNTLKRINDTYGHDKGDIYLCRACHAICDVFVHSPVFRIGGDEFVSILEDHAYEMRDELANEFWEHQEAKSAEAQQAWEKVNLAMGMAVFDPATDKNVQDVARRADDLMYQNKNEYKAQHGIIDR